MAKTIDAEVEVKHLRGLQAKLVWEARRILELQAKGFYVEHLQAQVDQLLDEVVGLRAELRAAGVVLP